MPDGSLPLLHEARRSYHAALLESILREDRAGVPSNADKGSKASVRIARHIIRSLRPETEGALLVEKLDRIAGQSAGREFERLTAAFLEATFPRLAHLRPGSWRVIGSGTQNIGDYEQYAHLATLKAVVDERNDLAAILGTDYVIRPDVLVVRGVEPNSNIKAVESFVDDKIGDRSSLRAGEDRLPLLHASISCKWTLRSDRAQNARSEALNLIRNRKGRAPHFVIVTGEPLPARLALIALGTGDIDCVYHFALGELREAVEQNIDDSASKRALATMLDGKRLKDIADLPLDLAI